VGVAVLLDDGTTDTWQVNAADGQVTIRIEQGGVGLPSLAYRAQHPNWADNLLVPTNIMVSGRARRWGPNAGHGSPFTLERREIEK
jgi:hypothetical protein